MEEEGGDVWESELASENVQISDELLDSWDSLLPFLEESARVIHHETLTECLRNEAQHPHHPLHNHTFLCSTIPKFVYWLLKTPLMENELDCAINFLYRVLILISYYLNFLHPDPSVTFGLMRLVGCILDESHIYYKRAMRDQDTSEVLHIITKKNRTTKDPFISSSILKGHYPQLNELFIYTIARFTTQGGLHGLLNVHSSMPLSLGLLREVMNVYHRFVRALSEAGRANFIVPLRNDIFKVLLDLKEEELRPLQNQDIDRFIEEIHEFEFQKEMGYALDKDYAKFNLEFALKCFRSSLLPKRIHGLSCIDRVLRQNRPSQDLVAWLNDNEILLDLFGRDTHPELIRRSKDTLVFLAKEDGLNSELLDLIWSKATNKATNKESSQEAEVIRVLSSIIEKFPAKLASDFVTRTCRLPYSKFSPKLIELIARQAGHEVMGQVQHEDRHGGYQAMRLVVINLLLDFIRDENTPQISQQCFDVAQRQLLGLIKSLSQERSGAFCSLVVEIIQICVDRIRNGTELIQSMAMIRRATKFFFENTYLDRKHFFSELLIGHKLTELTINAFKAYKFAAKAHFRAKANNTSPRSQIPVNPNDIITGKNVFARHGDYLTNFRNFLGHLFDESWKNLYFFPIPVKMVGKLWQCAMTYSLSEVERDGDVQWLTDQCKKTSFFSHYPSRVQRQSDRCLQEHNLALQIEALKYLLDCFGRLDPTSITIPQFNCFKDCFIFVNRKLKRLRKSRNNLMVIDAELEGFQTLWDIVLNAELQVFNMALDFLVSLYLHSSLPDSLPDSDGSDEDDMRKSAVDEIRVELVHRSMQHISIALKSSSAVLAQRCVSVLGSFLDSIPRYGGSVPLHGFSEDESFGVGDVREGKKVPNARNELLEMERDPYHHIPSPSTASEREAVGSLQGIFGGDSEMLLIVALKQNNWSVCEAVDELLNDEKKEYFLQIAKRFEAEKENIAKQQEEIRKASLSGPLHPALCISHHQTYFEQLFQLLDMGGVNTDDVWRMIDGLPTNPQMLRRFSDIPSSVESLDWPSLFSPESPYRFLYALKIVGSFLGREGGEQACSLDEMLIWREFFVRSGGFAYLLSLLAGENAKQLTGNREWKRCLSKLLRIIFEFICVGSEKDEDLSSSSNEFRESTLQAFPSLFQQDHKVHQGLINSVDFGGVMPNLVKLLWSCAKTTKEEARWFEYNEDALMHGLCFLVLSLFSDKSQESWALLRDFPKIDDFFLDLLLRSEHRGTRVIAKESVEMLCRLASEKDCPLNQEAEKGPYRFFLKMLMLAVPPLFENHSDHADTEQFFELLNSLLRGGQGDEVDFTDFVLQILIYLQQREVVELGEYDPPDTLFNGLVSVVITIVSQNQRLREMVAKQSFTLNDGNESDVFRFLFECLFCNSPLPSKDLTEREIASRMEVALAKLRCKHQTSRMLVFDLLSALVQGNMESCSRALALLSGVLRGSEQRIVPACFAKPLNSMSRSATGFVGMQNLGCTCYINSVLQQLFLIPYVRNRVLCARPSYEEEEEEEGQKKVVQKNDVLLSELQRLFAFLAKGTTQYYNMKSFCERTNVNTGNQEDAHEYLNGLFDKLETSEKNSRVKDFLSLFRTKTGIETVCQNPSCDYRGESPQDCYMLSINVQGQSNLENALEAFATPEVIGEYRCDKCKQKKGCARRTSIRTLPPCLIIHLNRFDIDFETFTTRKLLHHFSFPVEINLQKYTLEGLSPLQKSKEEEPEENRGEKVSGLESSSGSSSDVGESNSILTSSSENVAMGGGPSGFDEKGKQKDEEEVNAQGEEADEAAEVEQDNKHLYRLRGCVVHSGTAQGGHYYSFIQGDQAGWFRFDDTNVSVFDASDLGNECFGGEQESAFDSWKKEPKPMTAYMLFYERVDGAQEMFEREKCLPDLSSIPQGILDDISTQNMEAYQEKQRFEESFMNFMLSLVSSVSSMPNPEPSLRSRALCVGTYYWMEIVSRTQDDDLFQRWLLSLFSLYEDNDVQCEWLLNMLVKRHHNYLRFMLIECQNKNIRDHFQRFLERILQYLSKKDAILLSHYHSLLQDASDQSSGAEGEGSNNVPLPYIEDLHPKILYGRDNVLNEKCKSAMLINYLINILESTRNNWPSFSNYFTLWLRFSLMTGWHSVYMVHRRVIFFLMDYLLGSKSPAFRSHNRAPIRDMQTGRSPKMYSFMKLLGLLVIRTHTDFTIQHPDVYQNLIKIDKSTYLLLNSDLFLSHLIFKHDKRHTSALEICRHLITGDPGKTERLFTIITHNMFQGDEFAFALLQDLLEHLIIPFKNDDIDRAAILMNPVNGLFVTLTNAPPSKADVFRFLNLFLDLAQQNEQFTRVMIENREEYQAWIFSYLRNCDRVPIMHDHARVLRYKFHELWEGVEERGVERAEYEDFDDPEEDIHEYRDYNFE